MTLLKSCGKRNVLSRKYLWTVFMAVLCIALVLTVSLFFLYTSIQVAKATEYTVAQLEQACASTDILYNSMRAVVNQAIADSDTASFLLSGKTNRLQEAAVGIKLRSWRTASALAQSLPEHILKCHILSLISRRVYIGKIIPDCFIAHPAGIRRSVQYIHIIEHT